MIRTSLGCVWLLMVFSVSLLGLSHALKAEVRVSNVRRVFHNGEHNAFTDMTEFNGRYFLAFRSCPDGHGVSANASIIVLASDDLRDWEEVHRFRVANRDTRDPHFLIFKRQLFVYTGTWYSWDGPIEPDKYELNLQLGYGVCTSDGKQWTAPFELHGTFGHYVWRAATHDGVAYLCGRRKIGFQVGPRGEPDSIESLMLESDDGRIWRKRAVFQPTRGDETAFMFEPDGAITAIARRRGPALLLESNPPYREWETKELSQFIGGPLIAKWGGRVLVGGRQHTNDGSVTVLYWLRDGALHQFAELPSGGDTSYPGFIQLSDTQAVVSWYSTHETLQGRSNTAIYLADLELIQE